MKKDRQLVILLAALLVLIFLSSCAAGKNASMTPAATDFAYAEDDSQSKKGCRRGCCKGAGTMIRRSNTTVFYKSLAIRTRYLL